MDAQLYRMQIAAETANQAVNNLIDALSKTLAERDGLKSQLEKLTPKPEAPPVPPASP